ncbi:hypothetical protein MASR1M31_13590 [Porphyromonadaceae bacterium]
MLEGMDMQVELLMGSATQETRELIHESLMSGSEDSHGTHALLEDVVVPEPGSGGH